MPAAACPASDAEQRASAGRAEQEASADGGGRKQDDHQTCGQADSAAEHTADTRRGLVLLDDLDLALVVALDDGRVVGVDQVGVGVKLLDELVVRQGVGDIAVDAGSRRRGCRWACRAPLWMSDARIRCVLR